MTGRTERGQLIRLIPYFFGGNTLIDLGRSEIEHLIDEWILNERNRKILKRRLLDGICYEPLAEEFEMSTAQIKRIIYKGEEKIVSKIK